jgi:hypothetical protein
MANFSLCVIGNKNIGGINCDTSRGVLRQPFIFNDSFAAEDVSTPADFLAALVAGSKKGKNEIGKVFPLPTVEEITDKSDANKEGTLALGFKQILFEGRPAYEAKFFAGMVQLKSLRSFNGKTIGILEYDANKNMWGTVANNTFKGFRAKIFFSGGKIATGQNVEEGIVTVTISILDVNEYFDNAYMIPIEGNITEVEGLVDIELYQISQAANVFQIGARLQTSQFGQYLNIYDNFDDDLAVGALWEAFTGVGYGTALEIDSVAKNAATKGWTVTFDETAFNALPAGAKIKLMGVSPTDLDAADVTGVELSPVILTKAA